ncbi:MAG: General secretory pathway component, cryptic [Parcubacteria group bacterium GW2011_GWA1_47_8]|nr:MAG: General secretory pathway component, cryptic [Parcubacteria group bacterium GW2011_GWA1_47_8]
MATFIYEAYTREGAITHGEYEGATRDEVVAYLIKRDLTPISVDALKGQGGGGKGLSLTLFERVGPVDVMFLVRNLATMVKAGLSIVEALDILIADAEKNIMKRVLQGAQAMIKNGQSLSKGFEAHANLFPSIFLGMLRAGEASGQLGKTLTELAKYLSKDYALRSKVKSALMYPVILLVASSGVVVLLLIFVLPRLTKAFASSGVELPWITKFFLGLSSALTWSFLLDAVIVIVLVWFFLYFRTTRTGKKFFFLIISHTPVAHDLVKKVALVRFGRTTGNLVASGLSAVESGGMSISDAFAKYPDLFPRLLISLLVVAERTGTLSEILITFADFYEEEVDNKLKDLTATLEPALLLIMGLLVGSIAFSIILPIYQLVGHFT